MDSFMIICLQNQAIVLRRSQLPRHVVVVCSACRAERLGSEVTGALAGGVLRLGPPAPTSSICPIHATAARRADENQKPPGPASPLGHRGDSVTICFQ
ncbi:unnamed protein product [Rangifer tarandus platyrhynchus]|uniref:Uncharacterized protein n=1 Tax=Rangifer tarandus platyrhynchus TaxID=3082113 RepID=A0AC59Y7Y8_RANTA